MSRRGVLTGLVAALAILATVATAYAMVCSGGPAKERWVLDLATVSVDGQVVEDLSEYEPLTTNLESIIDQDRLRMVIIHDDYDQPQNFWLEPLDDAEEGGEL